MFVANRVAFINSFLIPDQWMHVESKQNQADYASRGLSFNFDNVKVDEWFNGPKFF